jgi:hypothetical protein
MFTLNINNYLTLIFWINTHFHRLRIYLKESKSKKNVLILYINDMIIIQINVEKSIELYKLLICCNLFEIFEAIMLSNLEFE